MPAGRRGGWRRRSCSGSSSRLSRAPGRAPAPRPSRRTAGAMFVRRSVEDDVLQDSRFEDVRVLRKEGRDRGQRPRLELRDAVDGHTTLRRVVEAGHTRIDVLLPAPLGPTSAIRSPRSVVSDTWRMPAAERRRLVQRIGRVEAISGAANAASSTPRRRAPPPNGSGPLRISSYRRSGRQTGPARKDGRTWRPFQALRGAITVAWSSSPARPFSPEQPSWPGAGRAPGWPGCCHPRRRACRRCRDRP